MTTSSLKPDYNSLHGPGESNFSSSSPHRLPTVSAADALAKLKNSAMRCVSTGLRDLDAILQNQNPAAPADEASHAFKGGVSRGRVTEVYGPSGVGKTAFGMQLTAGALHAGRAVTWIDASHPVPGPRLSQIINSYKPVSPPRPLSSSSHSTDLSESLTHFSTPSLAHLLALLAYQTANPSQITSLLIIDGFSTLIINAFPRNPDSNGTPKPGVPRPTTRKLPVLTHLLKTLQTLALTQNIAIVLLTHCVTKMRPGIGAMLVPVLNFPAWEQGLGCRVILFRDWGWEDEDGKAFDLRLAEVIKAEGIESGGRGRIAGFGIDENGLHSIAPPKLLRRTPPSGLSPPKNQIPLSSPCLPQNPRSNLGKRKLAATDLNFEIPDSEAEDDEDYGWGDEDEGTLPAMPPQWQGSEDILVSVPEVEEVQYEVGEGDGDGDGEGGRQMEFLGEAIDSEDELAL
ncbi:P-loop containing nucleoside triphosphate hydrolase protein [Calycina marina]|uniref:P-loop containing nucleoside triphosphate hydrolase protein n=1 Tax=Calycina marina TaxID=1763456 RepID=A0A9P7YY30_9HELO|nr:P-loop containing nucleoside triphosphate hydrolase protein [Calycina marina]